MKLRNAGKIIHLKVGVCALARPQHVGAIIPKIPDIKNVQIKRFVCGVLAVGLGGGRFSYAWRDLIR